MTIAEYFYKHEPNNFSMLSSAIEHFVEKLDIDQVNWAFFKLILSKPWGTNSQLDQILKDLLKISEMSLYLLIWFYFMLKMVSVI